MGSDPKYKKPGQPQSQPRNADDQSQLCNGFDGTFGSKAGELRLSCMSPLFTPDGRYIIHIGRRGPRLWRAANPDLSSEQLQNLTKQLMHARRAVKAALGNNAEVAAARIQVDAVKHALGERGAVWWDDGTPDYNRVLVRNSPYADWWKRGQPEA